LQWGSRAHREICIQFRTAHSIVTAHLRLRRSAARWDKVREPEPPGPHAFCGGCGLIRCGFEVFFPSIICSQAIALAENIEISAKIASKLPVIAFRAMNLIFVVGTATAGTARQLPVNGA
jgi:hypothetical protein